MNNSPLRDAAARAAIRNELGTNLLVEAGAGSGKTQSLAGRMVEAVASGLCRVDEVAAVTFTKKAAAELRGRFRLELERQIGLESDASRLERLRRAMIDVERMFAGTIHSFCARLLRERPVEAGLAPGFREVEEAEDGILRRRAWREFIEVALARRSPELAALRETGVKPADLDDAFTIVCEYPDVEFPSGDAQIPDARPGWAALERFWEDLNRLCPPVDPMSKCKVQAVMPDFGPRYSHSDRRRPSALPRLLATWESVDVVQKWWKPQGKEAKALVERFQETTVRPFLQQWREYVYRVCLTLLAEARVTAANQRRQAALLNFTDLLLFASRLLRENLQVREALQQKYRFLFVDEFQDTDPLQLELLFLLASEPGSGTDWSKVPLRPGALFLVGDPKQSIFRFRRADIEMYQQARHRIEETGGRVVSLTSCFRSGEGLCEWANNVFSSVFPAVVTAEQPSFERLDVPPEKKGSPGEVLRLSHGAEIERDDLETTDAEAIAAVIRAQIDSGKRTTGDFLILTRRKNGRLEPYAAALEDTGVPYEVSGSGGLLESPSVQAMASLLYALTHPDDGVALVGALRGPCFGLSDPDVYAYKKSGGAFNLNVAPNASVNGPVAAAMEQLREWRQLTRRLPAGAAIELILEGSGLLAAAAASSAGGGEAGKLVYAQDRIRAACETGMTLGDAVEALEQLEADDEADAPVLEPGRQDVVRLMNLHKAKGLEGKVVFLADPMAGVTARADIGIVREGAGARGYFAITKPKGEHGQETLAQPAGWASFEQEELRFVAAEESRLLYVAATRARELLVVSEWLGAVKGRVTKPWAALQPFLAARPAIEVPPWPVERFLGQPDLSPAARDAAAEERRAKFAHIAPPDFQTIAISSMAEHSVDHADLEVEGPTGRDWGSLLHSLLEYAAMNTECSMQELEAIARWHCAGQPVAQSIGEALDAVARVRASAFWDRVRQAEERLVEVPLAALQDEGAAVPIIARGVIDLALKCSDGWHIIDYKIDVAGMNRLVETYGAQVRGYAALWATITRETVAFAGLFSVRELALSADLRAAVQQAV
jgi:ATP-dependent helicase/nuclease subunit A